MFLRSEFAGQDEDSHILERYRFFHFGNFYLKAILTGISNLLRGFRVDIPLTRVE